MKLSDKLLDDNFDVRNLIVPTLFFWFYAMVTNRHTSYNGNSERSIG